MRILLILSILLTMASCSGNPYDLSAPEKLGEEVFNAIKDNDIDRMVHFVPTRDEMKRGAIEVAGASEEEVDKVFAKLDEEYGEGGNKIISQNIPAQFPKIREDLFKGKYNWEEAIYKKTYTNTITKDGYEYGELLVEVENHGELFYFTIEAGENIDHQWMISDDIHVVHHYSTFEKFGIEK